jgi:hypothetical protein
MAINSFDVHQNDEAARGGSSVRVSMTPSPQSRKRGTRDTPFLAREFAERHATLCRFGRKKRIVARGLAHYARRTFNHLAQERTMSIEQDNKPVVGRSLSGIPGKSCDAGATSTYADLGAAWLSHQIAKLGQKYLQYGGHFHIDVDTLLERAARMARAARAARSGDLCTYERAKIERIRCATIDAIDYCGRLR